MLNDFNGIEEYHNVFSVEYCDEIIRHFEIMSERGLINPNQRGADFVTDDRIVFDWAYTQNMYHYDFNLCAEFFGRIGEVYENEYMKKYSLLSESQQHSPKGMSVQRTGPSQGYHRWHAESACAGSSVRVVNYMLYLNTIEEGGETEFLYQGVKIKPEMGKIVFFPTAFTYPHRGNPIYKGYKYIITGWYTFDQ